MSAESARKALITEIRDGKDISVFLGRLAEADLTKDEIVLFIAEKADREAEIKLQQTRVVAKSVQGVEELAGTAAFELGRAVNLQKLASTLRG